ERTERVTHSADALRWAALDRARRFADDDLAALGRQIEVEAGALRHWTADPPPAGPSARPAAVTGDELSARPSALGSGEPSGITSEEPRDQVPQALRKTGRPKGTS